MVGKLGECYAVLMFVCLLLIGIYLSGNYVGDEYRNSDGAEAWELCVSNRSLIVLEKQRYESRNDKRMQELSYLYKKPQQRTAISRIITSGINGRFKDLDWNV